MIKHIFACVFAGFGVYMTITLIWAYAEKAIKSKITPNIIDTIIVAFVSAVIGYWLVN